MKSILVLLCVLAVASAGLLSNIAKEEWHAFKMQHDKVYENEHEDRLRMKIYAKNKQYIAKHNQLYEQGVVSYKLSQNKYGDMQHNEFLETLNGYNTTFRLNELYGTSGNERGATFIPPTHVTYPDQVDWTKKGAVTRVQHQGYKCGSCWAFSATGAVEGQHYRKTGRLVSLSEQNLVDCSSAYGNYGCKGGFPGNAFKYIMYNGGIDTEKTYPYRGVEGICRYNPRNSGAVVKGFIDIPQGNEESLTQAVATIGPVSVTIDASCFQFYSSGVFYDKRCSTNRFNHAMLVVGYGTDRKHGDYWLVKNSWGRHWGEQGYIKMARNRNNHCGIASFATYPLV